MRLQRTYFYPQPMQRMVHGRGHGKGFYLKRTPSISGGDIFWLCNGTDHGSTAHRITEEAYNLMVEACKIERAEWRRRQK
jgi:hypothetical protein